jgi:hypothetical protein
MHFMDKNIINQSLLWKSNLSLSSINISQNDTSHDKSFSYQLYLIFVGYHLKYFYPKRIYSKSNRNIDNIMAMFSSVYKSLTSNLLQRLNNKEAVIRELNSLVNYIDNNQEKQKKSMLLSKHNMK